MVESLSSIELEVLKLIIKDSHRPSALTRILKNKGIECDQNTVVSALVRLEKEKLVERHSKKAWIATSKAEPYITE